MQGNPLIAPSVFRDYESRNAHWLAAQPKALPRAVRHRPTEPLILTGFGVSLRIERGALVIRDGITHASQTRARYRFFPGHPGRPPRILMLDGSGSLSFDVLAWLAEQGVPLFKIDYTGRVISAVAGHASYDMARVNWQIGSREDLERRLTFSADLIASKLRASLDTLTKMVPVSPARDVAVAAALRELQTIEAGNVQTVGSLRLSEARAAAAYFRSWRSIAIAWRPRWKQKIPPEWMTIGQRRSMRSPAGTNRHATHPTNSVLNYAYAVLHSAVQMELVAEGLDPARGVMHESRADSSAFVLDMMEPRRPVIDAKVLRFLMDHTFSEVDFTRTGKGVCRLAPELARRVVSLT